MSLVEQESILVSILDDLSDELTLKGPITSDTLYIILFGDRSITEPGINNIFDECCAYLEMRGVEISYYDDMYDDGDGDYDDEIIISGLWED